MPQIKSVAVIGTGPAGAIAVDALVQEKSFDLVRVFERQEKAGGCWYEDSQGSQPSVNEINGR
jgi:cation diffusion facilitator CzcD-associated flavoprotein CzcO